MTANDLFYRIRKAILENNNVTFSIGIAFMLMLMIIPLPTFLLDLMLTISIATSLIILFVGIYADEPLSFSSFPTILLGSTLLRLALNISSTRLILLNGGDGIEAAGDIIKSFGQFVVGGNYVVGVVIFCILVIINFIVITKGATRIAEVAARFTLDAMPGKQLSIDADLSAGIISETEARQKREKIQSEADFYGAMDGASKFVRGDAIAGILITMINIVGGIAIGSLQENMSIMQCLEVYTILTVGDGLVSQIPALIISVASGLLVTRSSKQKSLGDNLAAQLLNYPKALSIVAVVLILFAFIPGMPFIPFFLLSLIFGAGGYYVDQSMKDKRRQEQLNTQTARKIKSQNDEEQIERVLPMDVLEVNVGYELISLVDKNKSGELLDRIKSIRKQFAQDYGIIIPPLHIRDNLSLKSGEYLILLKNNSIGRGELKQNFLMAMDAGGVATPIDGIKTVEPVFNLPAVWIGSNMQDQAIINGYTVVDHSTVIATHLTELLKTHMHELFGRQDLEILLNNFKKTYPKVVQELIPELLSFGTVLKVLQNLLREQVPVRDLLTILECLGDNAIYTKDPEVLTEFARQALARSISIQYLNSSGDLQVLTLAKEVEDVLSRSVKPSDRGSMLALDPNIAQSLLIQITKKLQSLTMLETQPIILCASTIRGHLKKLTERFIPNLVVLSYGELDTKIKIKSLGIIGLSDES